MAVTEKSHGAVRFRKGRNHKTRQTTRMLHARPKEDRLSVNLCNFPPNRPTAAQACGSPFGLFERVPRSGFDISAAMQGPLAALART